jgi:hypothetical protein
MTNTTPEETKVSNDSVNHPSHYTQYPVEVIQLTEHMDFCRGNAVKYLARAGFKDPAKELEDLRKARWYTDRAIAKLEDEIAKKAKADAEAEAKFTAGIWNSTTINIHPSNSETAVRNAAAKALYWELGAR